MLHCIYFVPQLHLKKLNLRINIHSFTSIKQSLDKSSANLHANKAKIAVHECMFPIIGRAHFISTSHFVIINIAELSYKKTFHRLVLNIFSPIL